MAGVSGSPTLHMTMPNADLFKRVSGPATVRNMAKAIMAEDKGNVQTSKPSQAADTYKKGDTTSLSALLGTSSAVSYTPEAANAAAARGVPTHGFLFHDMDAMTKAAADPEKGLDKSFARDTLDFFTGGKYKAEDVDKLNDQMTAAFREAAQQIADTGKADPTKLKSRLNINGAEVSLSQLAEFQTAVRQLAPAFQGVSADNSRYQDVQASAKMAVAKRVGERFGQGKGQIGEMFGQAVDRLYEKGMSRVDQLYTDASETGSASTASKRAAQLRGRVADMFSGLDITNNSVMGKDFSQKLSVMKDMMSQQDRQFGMPSGGISAGMAARNVGMYFSAVSRMFGA